MERHPTKLSLNALISAGVRALYQPIVHLDTGQVIAFEALARRPEGSPLESPAALFEAARQQQATCELDWACRAAAVRGALEGGMRAPTALFVNVEPDALGTPPGEQHRKLFERAINRLSVFVEVTERALTVDPARLLQSVEGLRAAGFGIALDDVGADKRSLALLPLLRPDVVKLDMSLIHNHPSRMSGEVMNGVCAYAEQTGALILAEGVENEQHLLAARSLGASLAQGWYFGRPGQLPTQFDAPRAPMTLGVPSREVPPSPVELVQCHRPLRFGRKDVLLSVTRALEAQALDLGDHAVVVATFQDVRRFTEATRLRYESIAERAALTAALGAGMSDSPARGVRGAHLAPDDPLLDEWDIAVLGPHYAGALVARDLGDDAPDLERRFEYVLTFDRELVIDVAAAMITRITASVDVGYALAA